MSARPRAVLRARRLSAWSLDIRRSHRIAAKAKPSWMAWHRFVVGDTGCCQLCPPIKQVKGGA